MELTVNDINHALQMARSQNKSTVDRIVFNCDDFVDLYEHKTFIHWDPHKCAYFIDVGANTFIRATSTGEINSGLFNIKFADGGFCAFQVHDYTFEAKCWCGLSASIKAGGYGGLHADYCHPDLAGKPG